MFIKVGLDDLSPVWIVFVRTVLAALVLWPIALSRGVLGSVRPVIGWVLALGAVQIAGPFLLIGLGEEHVTSSLAGILVSAVPIFTALLALRFDAAERARGWALVGIVIGIGGVALLFGLDLTGGTAAVLGGVGILVASLGYAIAGMVTKHRLHGVAPLAIVSYTMLTAAVLMVPLLPFSAPDHAPALDTIGSMLALGVGGTGLAFLLFYTLVHEVGPARNDARRLHRARLLRRVRRAAARRAGHRRHDRGPRAHPLRLLPRCGGAPAVGRPAGRARRRAVRCRG